MKLNNLDAVGEILLLLYERNITSISYSINKINDELIYFYIDISQEIVDKIWNSIPGWVAQHRIYETE